MDEIKKGVYEATINDIRIVDGYEGKGFEVQFDVYLKDPAIDRTCKHGSGSWDKGKPTDDRAKRFKQVMDKFKIASLTDLPSLRTFIGHDIDVRVSEYNGKPTFYINTARPELADDAINAKLALMAGDDNIPF